MILKRLTDIPVKGIRIISGSCTIQTASITSRNTRGEPLSLKAPFPYGKKKLRWYHEFLDPVIVRICQENAKIIVVEGPIGAGKSAFCQALAEQFEMKYFPQPTMDEVYVLDSGYDFRQHDDEVPEDVRTYDHKNFCVNPFDIRATYLQFQTFFLKFHQYVDAMCHLTNTGQGCILERSYLSDYVFLKAMVENKYVDPSYLKIYSKIRKQVYPCFPDPHLVIYLDMPVAVVEERIKTRNYSYEQNSPALTPQYLASLEKFMKQDYLKSARKSSEILIYDWSDGGNVDVVIDDIENIDFDVMRGDRRFVSWWFARKHFMYTRKRVTNNPVSYNKLFFYDWYKADEMFNFFKKLNVWHKIIERVPHGKYDYGYNPHVGDSIFSILFKTQKEKFRKYRFHLNGCSD